MQEPWLHKRPHPSRIYLETTTRCNLSCAMCVKQSSGGDIAEGDFSPAAFAALESALPHLESLILNGIGEPMLYPHLEDLIRYASEHMKPGAHIGFQTNGMLVTGENARSLIEAGLNLLCVSMDASTSDTFSAMREGGDISGAENAISIFRDESRASGRNMELGIEFVLTRENLGHLIPTLKLAAERGAGFAIVTHLIAYDPGMADRAAYDRNTDRAVELYEKTVKQAASEGIDITKYFDIRWRFNHTPEEERILRAVEEMNAEARKEGIFMHLQGIITRDSEINGKVEEVFRQAESIASDLGIELSLPASSPRGEKRCDFIESGSLFISWNGDVHPCHFLWHKFQCHISGWKKFVKPVSFGNLGGNNIMDIWNSDDYVKFRETVSKYDYPLCSNCSLAPCDYIYSENFEQDCYTNTIPCCDCQWCLGIFQCLK